MIFNSLIPSGGGAEVKTAESYSSDAANLSFTVDGEPKWWLLHAKVIGINSSANQLAIFGSETQSLYITTNQWMQSVSAPPTSSYSNGTLSFTRYSSSYVFTRGMAYKYTLYYTT